MWSRMVTGLRPLRWDLLKKCPCRIRRVNSLLPAGAEDRWTASYHCFSDPKRKVAAVLEAGVMI